MSDLQKKNFIPLVILGALGYLALFHGLDFLPVRLWDESRLAVNAQEMYWYGDWIVTHFEGDPDMWNTKPPLMIWLQVIGTHLFGIGELALRLPSALAGLATILIVGLAAYRLSREYWVALLSSAILLSSVGFVTIHGTRTGDYDALLTMFTTLGCLFYFAYLHTDRSRYLLWFFVFLTLSVLTKSVTGLLFAPALLIFTMIKKKLWTTLQKPSFYLGIGIFIIFALGYYALREHYNPGYLRAVYDNELGGRMTQVLESNTGPFYFYLKGFFPIRYVPWVFFILPSLIWGAFYSPARWRSFLTYIAILEVTFFLVISSAATKLGWYDLPLYPFMAMSCSFFIIYLISLIFDRRQMSESKRSTFFPLVIFALLLWPAVNLYRVNHTPIEVSEDNKEYAASYLLQSALRGERDLTDEYICEQGYHAQNIYYMNALRREGVNTGFVIKDTLHDGQVVYAWEEGVKTYLDEVYNTETKAENYLLNRYHILNRKNDE